MLQINLFHILCILFILVIENNLKPKNDVKKQKDLLRDSFPHLDEKLQNNTWFIYMLTCLPLLVLFKTPHKTDIVHITEHLVALVVISIIYKKVVNIITPHSASIIDYKTIIHVLTSLICLQHNAVSRSSLNNVYVLMILHFLTNLHTYHHTTTKSIFDDIIISHLMFYVFR